MARIFITGSADGLGLMAARLLAADGHRVVLHARNKGRAQEALASLPGAENAVFGDLASITETKHVAERVNEMGIFDAVIHNAAIGHRESHRIETIDGLPNVFAVNSLAPYVLTCLIMKPRRLVYVSSGMHRSGDPTLRDLTWNARPWDGSSAYADSKLHNVILAFAVARKWPNVLSNALDPGWVATKMGGPGAPDSLEEGSKTQAWLATSQEKSALVSGKYFYHQMLRNYHSAAADVDIQERYLSECARLSGISFPVK
jgi:NAD(P)-dependent dehydrogenase (short-subunit alcohol dehydrogenase family)